MSVKSDGSYIFVGLNVNGTTYPEESKLLYLYNINTIGNIASSYQIKLPFGSNWSFIDPVTTTESVAGNNLIFGTFDASLSDADNYYRSFIIECDNSGNTFWAKQYYFPQSSPEATQLTDGVITPDGGYLFCGYITCTTSKFFLMKTDARGDTLWTKFYISGKMDATTNLITPYAAGTSSLIALNNGNYMLFNGPSPLGSDNSANQSAWIYTISSTGDSLNSTQINYQPGNYPAWAVKENSGNVFALMNLTNGLEYSGNGFIQQNANYVSLSPGLSILSQGYFQTRYTDYFQSLCLTSGGNIACFGMIQSLGKDYYKPELIIINGQ